MALPSVALMIQTAPAFAAVKPWPKMEQMPALRGGDRRHRVERYRQHDAPGSPWPRLQLRHGPRMGPQAWAELTWRQAIRLRQDLGTDPRQVDRAPAWKRTCFMRR